jgi:hypothetical protein
MMRAWAINITLLTELISECQQKIEQMPIERTEEKIKTPQTPGFSFYLFSASLRLGVENCFSIPSHQICSKSADFF